MNPEEVASLVVPEFAGNLAGGGISWATGTYWGRNGFKDNHEYAGLIVLLLAAVSFLGGPRRQLRLFLTGLGGLAVLFSLGANTPDLGLVLSIRPRNQPLPGTWYGFFPVWFRCNYPERART